MRIATARAQMISARDELAKREKDTAEMRSGNPAIRLHNGPRERYNVACKRFVVAQLEHLMLKRQRNVAELMAARDELSFSRLLFFKNQEVIALENRRNQFNYEVAQRRFNCLRIATINQEPTIKEELDQKRFTRIHKRLRTLKMAAINQEPATKEELDQRRFTSIHKRLRTLRMATINQGPTVKNSK